MNKSTDDDTPADRALREARGKPSGVEAYRKERIDQITNKLCVCGKKGKRPCEKCPYRLYCSKPCLKADREIHALEHKAIQLNQETQSVSPEESVKQMEGIQRVLSAELIDRMLTTVGEWNKNLSIFISDEVRNGSRRCKGKDAVHEYVLNMLHVLFDTAMRKALTEAFGPKIT